jgi:hypothetical protein
VSSYDRGVTAEGDMLTFVDVFPDVFPDVVLTSLQLS